MIWTKPIWFLILLPFVLLLIFYRFKTGRSAVGFSSSMAFSDAPKTLRQRLLFVPDFLRLIMLLTLVGAAARPVQVLNFQKRITEGLAIEIVLDRSSSMNQQIETANGVETRFDMVKDVISDFVFGNEGSLKGRENDLIGLISFAKYADTNYPLSLTHQPLKDFLGMMQTVAVREEDGTSIGDAVALAAARLKTYNSSAEDYQIKSRIMILLTDGVNNSGSISPKEAADLAAEWGIKIYTIGIQAGRSNNALTNLLMGSGVDTQTLEYMASVTGGEFFTATSNRDLLQIYSQIDQLEKSQISDTEYTEIKELYHYFLIAALCLLAGEFLLRHLILRRSPL